MDLLNQLENCDLMSAQLEIKLKNGEEVGELINKINTQSDYTVKSCFLDQKSKKLYLIDIIKK